MTKLLEKISVKTIKTIDRVCVNCKKGILTKDRSNLANQAFLDSYDIIEDVENVSHKYKCPVCNHYEHVFGTYPKKEEKINVYYEEW